MLKEIQDYWNDRSQSYAQENLRELNSEKRQKWEDVFSKYSPKPFREMKVLDIGCGPGIFSIILSNLGAKLSAIDYTPNMLLCAKKNACTQGVEIDFYQGDAQNLAFEDKSFDLVISRNLTWNLSEPYRAYQEWYRVLKKGGRMMNFDANWYLQLYDDIQKQQYQRDRDKIAKLGIPDHMTNLYPNAQKMEDIAKSLPLSKIHRPQWDREVLNSIGFETLVCDEEFYQYIWDEEEKLMFKATPMFLLVAQK